MKCPLFHAANMTHEERILNDPEDCLKEECAWWGMYYDLKGKKIGCCSIVAIALALSDILKKVPHIAEFPLTGAD